MNSFPLQIVTPDGLLFDGAAEELIVRTASGDLAVLAGHVNCVCPLGMGRAVVVANGEKRAAACIGGILSVLDGLVRLVPTTFEWADKIDLSRAEAAEAKARGLIEAKASDAGELRLAQARLRRALVRKSVALGGKK